MKKLHAITGAVASFTIAFSWGRAVLEVLAPPAGVIVAIVGALATGWFLGGLVDFWGDK